MAEQESPAVRNANKHFRREEQAKAGATAWNEYLEQQNATRLKNGEVAHTAVGEGSGSRRRRGYSTEAGCSGSIGEAIAPRRLISRGTILLAPSRTDTSQQRRSRPRRQDGRAATPLRRDALGAKPRRHAVRFIKTIHRVSHSRPASPSVTRSPPILRLVALKSARPMIARATPAGNVPQVCPLRWLVTVTLGGAALAALMFANRPVTSAELTNAVEIVKMLRRVMAFSPAVRLEP